MFFCIKQSGPRSYLQIVANQREDGAVRQKVIATIGRTDELAASGGLASLLASGARHCEQVLLLSTLQADLEGPRVLAKRIGAPLLFGRLWEETGCRAVVEDLLAGRGFEFPVERAVFALSRPDPGGAALPDDQGADAHATDLPLIRRGDPRSCVLLLPRPDPAQGAGRALRQGGLAA